MCIKMLQLLNTGRVYQVSKLAEILETNKRNIIEYKRELEEAGYVIISVSGKYGGYQLDRSNIFPALKLTADEKKELIDGFSFLNSNVEFLNSNSFKTAEAKVLSAINHEIVENNLKIINKFPYALSKADLNERYSIIKDSIKDFKAVRIKYSNDYNEESSFLYHPYELFMYDDMWHVIGWNELLYDIDILKLNKIIEITIDRKSFDIYKFYERSDYLDEFGIKESGLWHRVEFVAYNQYSSYVKERIYGRNQIVTPLDSNSTLVSVDMQNKEKITSFILSFTDDIKVLGPKWLIDEMKRHADYFRELYKEEEK